MQSAPLLGSRARASSSAAVGGLHCRRCTDGCASLRCSDSCVTLSTRTATPRAPSRRDRLHFAVASVVAGAAPGPGRLLPLVGVEVRRRNAREEEPGAGAVDVALQPLRPRLHRHLERAQAVGHLVRRRRRRLERTPPARTPPPNTCTVSVRGVSQPDRSHGTHTLTGLSCSGGATRGRS
jgi:hypothetical protein